MLNAGFNRCLRIVILLLLFFNAPAQQPDWNQYTQVKERLAAIRQYGTELIKKQQYDQAIRVFNTGFEISRRASLDSLAAANLILLGRVYRYKVRYDSAFFYLRKANEIAVEKKYIALQAAIQIESYTVFNGIGKSDSAAAVINRLNEILPELDTNSSESAKIEMYLGHDDKHKAKYAEALEHYYKSLRIAGYLKDSVNEGSIYISLANVMVLLGQRDKALSYHRLAANLFTEMGRRFELVNEFMNIADMYITSGQLDSGELYVRKSLTIIGEMKNKSYLPNVYLDLGYIYEHRKRFRESGDYFLEAIRFSRELSNELCLMNAYQGLGEMYMADHQPAIAAPYLEKHLLLAKQHGDREEIIEAIGNLAENENTLHHYDKAYAYQKLFNVYKDSAYTESTEKSMAEMESKYQAEKKEKEIGLLKKDQLLNRLNLQKQKNFQIAALIFLFLLLLIAFLVINRYRILQRTKRLVEMERMRNTIARDLHDDIGSTLTSINILSKVALQEQVLGESPMAANMQKIKERSASIMESMHDIIWAINPKHDTLEQMIFRMKEFAAEILEPQGIQYLFHTAGDFSAVKLDINKRKDFYLLFKEAVNNAAKYSGCHNLDIRLAQEQQCLLLKIEDDGTGFKEGEIKNGNGLVNMRARAVSMKAGFQIDSASGRGTRIEVEVPIT